MSVIAPGSKTTLAMTGAGVALNRQLDIPREMDNLHNEIGILTDMVCQLQNRLDAAMHSSPPQDKCTGEVCQSPSTGLSSQIRDAANLVAMNRMRVGDILERLEL